MFSDSAHQLINDLLKEVKRYADPPFSYALDFETEISDALENLIYIRLRLDDPNLERFKKAKIMLMAKQEAKIYIDRIKQGKEAFSEDEEELESDESDESDEKTSHSESIISDLKQLNSRLKAFDAKLERFHKKHNLKFD